MTCVWIRGLQEKEGVPDLRVTYRGLAGTTAGDDSGGGEGGRAGPQASAWRPPLLAEGCEKTMEEHNSGDTDGPDRTLPEADRPPGGQQGGGKPQLSRDED